MVQYVDDRDSGSIIVTHIYLLLGCASPLWLEEMSASSQRLLCSLAGVNVLGVGDAMSALVGTLYGKHHIFSGRSKTLEGSSAFFISMMVFNLLLFHFSEFTGTMVWVYFIL